MKYVITLILLTISFSSFAQGLIFESDRNQVLQGPGFFQVGVSNQGELIEIKSEAPLFASPITGKVLSEKMLVNKLLGHIERRNTKELACIGKTEIINGILQLVKTDVCVKIVDGEVVFRSSDLSDEDLEKARFDIDEVLWERLGSDELSQRVNDSRRQEIPEPVEIQQAPHVREVPPSYRR